jgi:hypothetical protein
MYMEKIIYISILALGIFLTSLPLHAATTPPKASPPKIIPVYIEGGVGLFYPTSALFRQIYSVGPLYNIELDVQPYKGLVVWTNVSVFPSSGYSVGRNNPTSIIMVPIGVGLKYLFPLLRKFRPYLGAGVVPTYFSIDNDNSPYVSKRNQGWGCGGVVKSGVLAYIGNRFFIDVFLNYNYIKTRLHNSPSPPVTTYPINASNVTFGADLSYHF